MTQPSKAERSLSRNIGTTVYARVGYMVSRFAIPPFVLAHMSLKEYGLWTSIFILVSYLGISTMGLSNVYIRYVAKYNAERSYRRANQLLSTGVLLTLPLCTLLFILFACTLGQLTAWLHLPVELESSSREAVIMVVAVFLSSISLSAFNDALNGVQRIDVVQKMWIVGYILETVLIFVLVGMGRGLRGMAEAFFLRTVVSIALSIVYAYRYIPWLQLSPKLFSRDAVKDLLSFGSVVQVQCFLDILLSSAERLIALLAGSVEAAGLLDIAKKMPTSIAAVPLAFVAAFLPAASDLEASRRDQSGPAVVRDLYLEGSRYMNLVGAYFCGFLAAFAAPILSIWIARPMPGVGFLMLLFALSLQVHLLTGPGTSIMKGIGRPMEEFHYCLPNLAALIATTLFYRWLNGGFTMLGIGSAVVTATFFSASYFLIRMARQFHIPLGVYLRRVVLPGYVPHLVALVLSVGWWGLQAAGSLPASRWLAACVLCLFGAVYTLIVAGVIYGWMLEPSHQASVRWRLSRYSGGRITPLPTNVSEVRA